MNRLILLGGVLLVTAIMLSGCTATKNIVVDRLREDLQRTSELAEKYGDADVQACALFLSSALAESRALAEEPTNGVLSFSFKSLLQRYAAMAREDEFIHSCSPVATRMLMELGRQIR